MTINHDIKNHPRLVGTAIADRLSVMPAVLVTRARHTLKRSLPAYRTTRQPDGVGARRIEPAEIGYWRTASGEEVDLVIESGARLLLHTGTTLEWLAPDVLAVPWWRVL